MPKKRKSNAPIESWMSHTLDDFQEFQEHKKLHNKLLKMVNSGASPEKIYEEFGAALAARMVALGMTERNPAMLKAVVQEIHNRSLGKPTERQEVTHKYEQMSEEDLDKILSEQLDQVKKKEEELH